MSAKDPPTKGPRTSDRINNKKATSISMVKVDDNTLGMSTKNGQNSQICSLTCNNLLWNSIQTILFILSLVVKCSASKCDSEICKTPIDLDLNFNGTLKNGLIRSIFNCENPTPFKYIPVDNLNSCNLTLDKNRANIYKFKAKASKLITVMTHLNVYECTIVEIISVCRVGPWRYIGAVKETRTEVEKLVNYAECIEAVQTKRSLYGKLYLKNANT